MRNWEPITTAPKDGTEILGLEGEVMAQMSWSGYSYQTKCFRLTRLVWGDESSECNPTHWMPLLELPK